jgi:hypothetical protein
MIPERAMEMPRKRGFSAMKVQKFLRANLWFSHVHV